MTYSIPVVQAHPQIQLWQWTFTPLEFLNDCQQRYGDCFQVRFGNLQPAVFFSHPDAIADLFSSSQASRLDAGRTQLFLRLILGENSTILLDGQEHRRHRQLLLPPMHGDRMRTYGDIICQTTQQATQDWSLGQKITLEQVLNDITFQVILKAMFGFQGTQCEVELTQQIRRFLGSLHSPLLYYLAVTFPPVLQDWGSWSPAGRYWRQIQELDRLLFQAIREHRDRLNANDIDVLTMLMLARDEAGEAMTDGELRDEMLSLLFAGQGTTSVVTAWAFYFLHAHPPILERLLAEIDSLGAEPSPHELTRLPYLNAVCQESMRLRSSVPASTARIANDTVWIRGQEFPPESLLVPAQHLTHHRADLYPQPRRFNPDRFLDRRYSNSEFYPFGGGTRYCVGAAFALYEMKLILATVLRRYRLELENTQPIQTVRQGVNIAPKGGVKMIMTDFRQPSKIYFTASPR
jgi:cytochrome P450 family 110